LNSGFGENPRTPPNITITLFLITAKNPEVQKCLDQVIALLHSFSDYKAELASGWDHKLEAERQRGG
jgi:hypothetical protein